MNTLTDKRIMKADFTPHAYYAATDCPGISIQIDDERQKIRYRINNEKASRWVNLYFNKNGAFFNIGSKRYHLNNFMRIH